MPALRTGLLDRPHRLESKLRFLPYALDVWCPLLRAAELRKATIRRTEIIGKRVALFRDSAGTVGAVLDRCPHRGIELSLGRVCDSSIQCAYHGWRIDRSGVVISAPGIRRMDPAPSVEAFEVCERYGLIWIFIGDRAIAASTPLPDLAPFGTDASVDILISKEVRAHWSLVLDNGLDLFHQHLHRDIPIFFKIESLEGFGSDGAAFHVHYKAVMSSHYGKRRRGDLRIRAADGLVTLDLNGFPIIHSVSTPRSADGRRLTTWWFIACPGPWVHRLFTAVVRPIVQRYISRGFDQDAMVLESEQRAFERGLRTQIELNPVVLAAHSHYGSRVAQFARSKMRSFKAVELADPGALLEEINSGAIAVLIYRNGEFALVDPVELALSLSRTASVRVVRYANVVVVCAD